MSDPQLALWQWGRWYRGIFDLPAPDRPSDKIIEDDGQLDRWYKGFCADQARRLAQARGGQRSAGGNVGSGVNFFGGSGDG